MALLLKRLLRSRSNNESNSFTTAKPYQDGQMVNMFAALELDELAPEVGARLRKEEKANYISRWLHKPS